MCGEGAILPPHFSLTGLFNLNTHVNVVEKRCDSISTVDQVLFSHRFFQYVMLWSQVEGIFSKLVIKKLYQSCLLQKTRSSHLSLIWHNWTVSLIRYAKYRVVRFCSVAQITFVQYDNILCDCFKKSNKLQKFFCCCSDSKNCRLFYEQYKWHRRYISTRLFSCGNYSLDSAFSFNKTAQHDYFAGQDNYTLVHAQLRTVIQIPVRIFACLVFAILIQDVAP